MIRWISRIAAAITIGFIRVYQVTLSPLLGPACRFEPTCSRYMIEAIKRYGVASGIARGIKRVLRCHPWHPGGYDPP